MTIDNAAYEEWSSLNKTPDPKVSDPVTMFEEALCHMKEVIDLGGRKYGYGSYLDVDNNSMQHNNNCSSMFRHLAEFMTNPSAHDAESGVSPLLHLSFRALAAYTRIIKGIDTPAKKQLCQYPHKSLVTMTFSVPAHTDMDSIGDGLMMHGVCGYNTIHDGPTDTVVADVWANPELVQQGQLEIQTWLDAKLGETK